MLTNLPGQDDATRSPMLLIFGIGCATLCFVASLKTGDVTHFLAALAFMFIAPVWYVMPLSFTESLRSHWARQRPGCLPGWAQVLTVFALVLLFASVGLRWVL